MLHSEKTGVAEGDERAGQRRIQCQTPPRGRVPAGGQGDDRRGKAAKRDMCRPKNCDPMMPMPAAHSVTRARLYRGDGCRRHERLRGLSSTPALRQHRVREGVQQDEDSKRASSIPAPHDDPPTGSSTAIGGGPYFHGLRM